MSSAAEEWVNGFNEEAANFATTRRTIAPAVRVTLADGDLFLASRFRPGPGPDHVTIDAAALDEQQAKSEQIKTVTVHEGYPFATYYTPRSVVVRLADIAKVEMFKDIPPPPPRRRWWRRGELTVRVGVAHYRLPGSQAK